MQITMMAAHNGGSTTLLEFLRLRPDWTRLRYERDEVVKMVSYMSGGKALSYLVSVHDQLAVPPLEKKHIIKLMCHHGAAKSIKNLLIYLPRLIEKGLNADSILDLALGTKAVERMQACLRSNDLGEPQTISSSLHGQSMFNYAENSNIPPQAPQVTITSKP